MYLSANQTDISSKTSIDSIYNTTNKDTTRKSWKLHHIPLGETYTNNSKLPKNIAKSEYPKYETDLPNYSDRNIAKQLRPVNRQDFSPIIIQDETDLEKIIGTCGGKDISYKHSHLISWDYEVDTEHKTRYRKGKVAYRNSSFVKEANVIMADCDGTIPIEDFKERYKNYRWFIRTSFGHTEEKHKFHVFFLLDEYQAKDKLVEFNNKLLTEKHKDIQIFDAIPFKFGSMLAGHYREDIKVVWNTGYCITNLCNLIELKEEEKVIKKSKTKAYFQDTSNLDRGKYRRRVESARKQGFLVSCNETYAVLKSIHEKTEGGYTLWSNNVDKVYYHGARDKEVRTWVEFLKDNGYKLEAHYDLSHALEVDEALEQIKTLMETQGTSNRVYKISAGVGKTESAIKYLMYRIKKRNLMNVVSREKVAVFVPSHKLAKELGTRIKKIHKEAKVKIIKGRTHKDEKTCVKAKNDEDFSRLMNSVGSEGLGTFSTFCMNAITKQTCVHFSTCPYINQYKHASEANIVIYTHEHLSLHPVEYLDKEVGEYDRVIIDEGFYGSLIYNKTIERKNIINYFKIAGNNERLLLELLSDSCRIKLDGTSEPILKSVRDSKISLEAALEECLSHSYQKNINPRSDNDKVVKELEKYKNTYIPMEELIEALQREINYERIESNAVKVNGNGDIQLFSKKHITDKFRNLPITYLDASAPSQSFLKSLTDIDFEYKEIFCKDKATYYYENVGYTNQETVKKKNDYGKKIEDKKKVREELKRVITNLTGRVFGKAEDTYKVLLCSYKDYITEDLSDLPDKIKRVYFKQGIRGIDNLKDCDVAYIVGRNIPSLEAIENEARSIYSDTPFTLNFMRQGSWLKKEIQGMETTDGKVIEVETEVHTDSRIQEVVKQIREEEHLQVIARLRSVHLEGKKIVFSGKIVLPVRVERSISRHNILHTGFADIIRDLEKNKEDILSTNSEEISKRYSNTDYYKNYKRTKQEKLKGLVSKDKIDKEKERLTSFLSSLEEGKEKTLEKLLHKHFGLGHYKYKNHGKKDWNKTGKLKGNVRSLITYNTDEKDIRKRLSLLLDVPEEHIELTCIIPPDTGVSLELKTHRLEETLFNFKEWLLDNDTKEEYSSDKQHYYENLSPP